MTEVIPLDSGCTLHFGKTAGRVFLLSCRPFYVVPRHVGPERTGGCRWDFQAACTHRVVVNSSKLRYLIYISRTKGLKCAQK